MVTRKNLQSAFMNKSALLLVVGLGMNLVGCSQQTNFLQNIGLNVDEQGGANYVNLSAKVDLGNAVFDSLQIPVNDPRTGENVGKVQLNTASDGKAQITLSVNASTMLNADPSLGSMLPNGRPIPSAVGAAAGELLAFPILNHSRVYIGGDLKTHVIAGVALAIQGLDNVMGQVGAPANLFFAKTINGVSGVAGVYGSPVANESGIAVFAKYTMPTQSISNRSAVKVAVKASRPKNQNTAESTLNQGLDDGDQSRLYNYFYGKKRHLRPH
jgi:hypothetical protein